MTGTLVFCVAEEAKVFIPKILDVKLRDGGGGDGLRIFYLVESCAGPSEDAQRLYEELRGIESIGQEQRNKVPFRRELQNHEPFETDFIGASQGECQKWALEKQSQHKFIEQDIIVIVDARSIKDDTVLLSHFNPKEDEPLEFGRYGYLPPEEDAWYNFRIDYKQAAEVVSSLNYGSIHSVYPTYFALKEQLTDERGIFDVAKAQRLVRGEDLAVLEY